MPVNVAAARVFATADEICTITRLGALVCRRSLPNQAAVSPAALGLVCLLRVPRDSLQGPHCTAIAQVSSIHRLARPDDFGLDINAIHSH
jgi:hypothetical protein